MVKYTKTIPIEWWVVGPLKDRWRVWLGWSGSGAKMWIGAGEFSTEEFRRTGGRGGKGGGDKSLGGKSGAGEFCLDCKQKHPEIITYLTINWK